jgi:hypothetical protein
VLGEAALPVEVGEGADPEVFQAAGHRLARLQRLHEISRGGALPGGGRERVDGLVEQAARVGDRAGEHAPSLLERVFEHKVKDAAQRTLHIRLRTVLAELSHPSPRRPCLRRAPAIAPSVHPPLCRQTRLSPRGHWQLRGVFVRWIRQAVRRCGRRGRRQRLGRRVHLVEPGRADVWRSVPGRADR